MYAKALIQIAVAIFTAMPAANTSRPDKNSNKPETQATASVAQGAMTGKVTFRVDTRNITVAPSGMFIAGSFLSTIGYTNWSFIPMCNLGSGIWEISFTDIPAGLFQYKFVNGNAPAGWEFNGFGGPCTNPADNNNRWVTVTGGTQIEGPHCYNTCNSFCPGFSDPGVSDLTPPTIDQPVPANITLTCGSPLPTPVALDASDGCDANVTTTTGPPTVNTSGLSACGTGTVVRTWSVTDCAGNTTSASQTITIVDSQNPVIISPTPPNVTVQCGSVPAPLPLNADDVCDASLVTTGPPLDNTSGLNACGTGNLLRTWTAADCSGNSTNTVQTIAIIDNTPPVITGPVPPNVTVSCQNIPPPATLPASDNCDASVTSTALPASNTTGIGPCGTGTLIRTWTATDCSGNSSSVSQTITLIDNTPPVINNTLPAVITLDCNSPLPAGTPLPVSDACDPGLSSTAPPVVNTNGVSSCGTGQIIRTWTATDCAGNSSSVSQTINLIDQTPPVITGAAPGNLTIPCGSSLPPGLPLTASDACDQNVLLTALPTDNLNGLSPCGTGTVTRTWVAADCSGNTSSVSQLITISDLTPPVISSGAPANVTVTCGNIPAGSPLPATDNCDQAVVSTGQPADNNAGLSACGTGQIIRTWTATDCAGNSSSVSQVITVVDNIPPTLTVPAAATYSCGNVPVPTPANASATDNCSTTPIVAYLGETSSGSGCSYQLQRTWSATDCQGNVTTQTQTIIVSDTQAPVFQNPPANLTVCSSDTPPLTSLTWIDNCDGTGSVNGTQQSNGMSDPEIITRTWTYTDACGNQVTHSQTITISAVISANAGPDQSVCIGEPSSLSGSGFGSASTFLWTSSGDGTFNASNLPNPVYTPGTNDQAAGSVSLVFTPVIFGGNCNISPDTLLLSILPLPVADAGEDLTLNCTADTISLNGSASPAGGTFDFLWSGPGIDSLNSSLPNPAVSQAGNYVLQINDGNCAATDTIEVAADFTPPTAAAGADLQLSCDVSSVELDGNGIPQAPDISWVWTGPGISSGNAGQQHPSVNQPGWYFLVVTDTENGCTAVDSVQVTADSDLPVADPGENQTLTCSEETALLDGSNSSSGSTIGYQWLDSQGSVISNDMSATVQAAGNYTLVVTDTGSGCSSSATVLVALDTLPPAAHAGVDITLTCFQSVAVLGETAASGLPLSYQWFNGSNPIGQEATLSVSAQGLFVLAVTDALNGCVAYDTALVMEDKAAPLAIAGPGQAINCNQDAVQLQGSSSIADADFFWTGPGINPSNQVLPNPLVSFSGSYTLVATNPVNGCISAPATVLVTADTLPPDLQIAVNGELTCENDAVVLSGIVAAQGNPVSYQWFFENNPLPGGTTSSWTASTTGSFGLTVTNTANGCSSSAAAIVTADSLAPVVSIQGSQLLDCEQPVATLSGSASPSLPGLEYQWTSTGGSFVGTNLQQPAVTVNQSGLYVLTVTNPLNGCVGSTSWQVQGDFEAPVLALPPAFEIGCQSQSVVLEATASASGGLSYSWTGPGFASDEPQPAVTQAGTYTLTVTSLANGCTAAVSTLVAVKPGIAAVDYQAFPPECQGQDNGSLDVTNIEGGSSPFAISLDGSPADAAGTFQGLAPGSYTLLVVDAAGCSLEQTVEIASPVPFALDLGDNLSINPGESVQLSANLSEAGNQFAWSNGSSLSCADCPDPVAQPRETTLYELTVTDSNGCVYTAEILVKVEVVFGIYIPSAFSPNGDGINDYFTIFSGPQVKSIARLQVFDRWGGHVFEVENILPGGTASGWDGNFRGRRVEAGSYAYFAELELVDGTREVVKGDVVVMY